MYRISELASRTGLARSTLLYYEKRGLLQGRRADNGYRIYGEEDLQQLVLVKALHAGGLSLGECQRVIEQGVDRTLLTRRLAQLDQEIAAKQQARGLLAGLLGQDKQALRDFHRQMEQDAPDAHCRWLAAEGLDETDVLRLRWLSRDLYNHETYMEDFLRIFEPLDRHGPGTDNDSLWALEQLPIAPTRALDMGCGPGRSTLMLAEQTGAKVVGLDNLQQSLDRLTQQAREKGLADRVEACNGSMTAPPFKPGSFDLIWSECSAYVMGFEAALNQWQPLLADDGYLVISELVWLTETPRQDLAAFWQNEYPDMQPREARLKQCEQHGYQLVAHRVQGTDAWQAYTGPLTRRLDELADEMAGTQAMADLRHELTILDQSEGQFSYMLMVLKKA